jgi:hypothetical protein
MLLKEGRQVHITDADGRQYRPEKFDQVLSFDRNHQSSFEVRRLGGSPSVHRPLAWRRPRTFQHFNLAILVHLLGHVGQIAHINHCEQWEVVRLSLSDAIGIDAAVARDSHLSFLLQLAASPMRVFARGVEGAFNVAVKRL